MRRGFTLIELLVVIAILGLLVAAFAPDIYNSLMGGQKAADKRHLQRLYEWMILYEQKHKTLPRGTGSKFVLDLWVPSYEPLVPDDPAPTVSGHLALDLLACEGSHLLEEQTSFVYAFSGPVRAGPFPVAVLPEEPEAAG